MSISNDAIFVNTHMHSKTSHCKTMINTKFKTMFFLELKEKAEQSGQGGAHRSFHTLCNVLLLMLMGSWVFILFLFLVNPTLLIFFCIYNYFITTLMGSYSSMNEKDGHDK